MSVVVLGEALIDLIIGDDGAYRPHLGGSPYNVAIGLARQNIGVSYLSPLSDDVFGDQFLDSLLREGVAVPISRRSKWPTSLALVTVDNLGLPTYRLYREGIADKDVSFDDLQAVLPDELTVFHTGSLAITPSQLPKIRRLIELVHERGAAVSIDINIRLRGSLDTKTYIDGVWSLLPEADIVKASDEDLEALGLSTDARESAKLARQAMGAGMLVLTEGRGGASLYYAEGAISKPSFVVNDVQDSVGAGDTFHSAFLAFLLRAGAITGRRIDADAEVLASALEFACAAAAINVSRVGCSPPTQAEVEDRRAGASMGLSGKIST